MRVLILGGYGFIGREVGARLMAAGHTIMVAGRDPGAARRAFPDAHWIQADLGQPQSLEAWHRWLEGIDAVVNAAGALQSGSRDDLEAVHHRSIAAVVRACETRGVGTFVQISAVGARLDAGTEFMRSKSRGDGAVASSSLRWFIVRPGLVIGPNAYGGTALIRMLAGVPWVQPMAFGDAPIQTVSTEDLAATVLDTIEGRLPAGAVFDLVEESSHSLRNIVAAFRERLGFDTARLEIEAPGWLVATIARVADGLGYLGWRSPLRSTALAVLADGVRGDPGELARIGGRPPMNLQQTLSRLPATLQERWHARLGLLMPATVAVLSVFWILTGVIALIHLDDSARLSGLASSVGRIGVTAGAIVDIALGAAIVYRRWTRAACAGMAIVTAFYLVAGSVLRPELWADPLGPLLKAVPILMLTLLAAVIVEDR